MGFFGKISKGQRNEISKADKTCPSSTATQETKKQSNLNAQANLNVQAVDKHLPAQRSSSIPSASIPNAQAFVTADTQYNAGAANYVQSVMKKKQMQDANKAEALHQAAQHQGMMQKAIHTASVQSKGGWPTLPPYTDIPGREMLNPAYHAMLAHLGLTKGDFVVINRHFGKFLDEMVKPHLVEKRHLLSAGKKTCDEYNEFLSYEWNIFASIGYVWDASLNEGAFRFFYPQSRQERFKWAEGVKGPYWDREDWDEWNEGKKRLGVA